MIRLVEDSAGIMKGGLAQVGSVAVIWPIRSATSWRARSSSVPRSKMSWIEDSWATDFERISSRPSMPPSWSSIGTVISSSTSLEELPSAIVWISTRGGANSGKTSTLVFGISAKPSAMSATAAKTTSHRNRRLLADDLTHQPHPPSAISARPRCRARRRRPLLRPTVTTAVPGGGPSDEQHQAAVDAVDDHLRAQERQVLGLV